MSINTDHQRLEPGSEVRLFVVDGTQFNGPELYFHSHTIPHSEDELEAAGDDPAGKINLVAGEGIQTLAGED